VRRGWTSPERARETYKVALHKPAGGMEWEIDEAATAELRAKGKRA
jgi:hypothetical protein